MTQMKTDPVCGAICGLIVGAIVSAAIWIPNGRPVDIIFSLSPTLLPLASLLIFISPQGGELKSWLGFCLLFLGYGWSAIMLFMLFYVTSI